MLFPAGIAPGQDTQKAEPPAAAATPAKPASAAPPAAAEKSKAGPEELEARFKSTLTQATLSGRWCLVQDGKLDADKEDKYTILSVTKGTGDLWLINARIQYGKADLVAPIPVQVKWAGDTPVITLDNIGLPGGHSYSARVLIYGDTYSGTWSGGGHAGLLHGVVTHDKP